MLQHCVTLKIVVANRHHLNPNFLHIKSPPCINLVQINAFKMFLYTYFIVIRETQKEYPESMDINIYVYLDCILIICSKFCFRNS